MSRDLQGTPGTRHAGSGSTKIFLFQWLTADSLALSGREFITLGYQGSRSHNPPVIINDISETAE